ncbi:MAG: PilN domain-containing protein [Candidatus Woesebacteria bacterium]|nr:PilN domain-containing protein [Candidatus Woesebacteria bacterium]
MPKNKAINLLPQEEFSVSLLGRTLTWAMGTFRIIVIVTEIIVMSAFLSRFWLDAQNSDLSNSIKVKSAQIAAQAAVEKDFRSLQSKLNIIKQISAAAPLSQKIDAVASKLPAGVNLISVSVLENSAQIRGSSATELGIAQFVANLKADPSFKSVDLTQTSSSEINIAQITFSVRISY